MAGSVGYPTALIKLSERKSHGQTDSKNKKRIWQAFETLSGKKAVTEITVAGLCELADINRSTFYQYYADIYALFEEIEQEYIQRVEFMIEKLRHTENSQEVVEEILEFLSLHRTAILYFLKNRQYTHFFGIRFGKTIMSAAIFRKKDWILRSGFCLWDVIKSIWTGWRGK